MNLIKCYMKQSTWYKGTGFITPKGILWHSTGCNNPNLARYVQPDDNAPNRDELIKIIGVNKYNNDWNHIYREAGLNYWIGKLADGSIATIQTGESNRKPWGCGGALNNTHIQFEICEDNTNNKDYFYKVYNEAIELCASLCKEYNLNPLGTFTYNGKTIPVITDHQESYKLGMGSNHGDIKHWAKKYLGDDYLNIIRQDIYNKMNEECDVMGCEYWVDGKCIKDQKKEETSKIEVGDLVQIIGDKYYSGTTIPNWVKKQLWYVYSTGDGVRIVINQNESKTNSIMSPINIKDLKLIKKG